MFVPLVALDLIVLTVWLALLAGITLPVWYWAPWQTIHGVRFHGTSSATSPTARTATRRYGLYIDTLPKALLAAAVCLIAVPAVQLRPGGDRPRARRRRAEPARRARGPAAARPERYSAVQGRCPPRKARLTPASPRNSYRTSGG